MPHVSISFWSPWSFHFSRMDKSQLETKVQLIALDNSDLDAGLNHIAFEGTKKCQKKLC